MAARRGQVEAIISILGEDKITAILQKVQKEVSDTGKKTDAIKTKTQRYRQAVQKAQGAWAQTAMGINSVIGIARELAGAVSAIGDQMKEAAQEYGIEARFRAVAQQVGGAALVLDQLRAASQDAIDDTALQKLFATASAGGMSLAQTLQAVEMGARAANAGYGSTIEMANKFISAISTGRDRVFKMAGWNVNLADTVSNLAKNLKVSTQALDESSKKQARFNALMRVANEELSSFSADGYVTQVDRVTASWENLQSSLRRQALLETVADPRWAELESAFESITKSKHVQTEVDREWSGSWRRASKTLIDSQKQLNAVLQETPGLTVILIEKIEALAASRVREAGFTDDSTTRTIAYNKAIRDIAAEYGVLHHVVDTASDNQAKLNKALTQGAAAASAAAESAKAQALANRQAKESIDLAIRGNMLKVETLMREAQYAEQIGRTDLATKKYKESLSLLPDLHFQTAEQAAIAARAVNALNDAQSKTPAETYAAKAERMVSSEIRAANATLRLQTALYNKYSAMGKNGPASVAYNKAMAAVRQGAGWTVQSLNMVAKASNNSAAALRASVLAQAKVSLEAGKLLMADHDAAMRSAGTAMVNAAEVTINNLKKIQVQAKNITTGGGGGGGGGSRSERKWFKRLQKPASEALKLLTDDVAIADNQIRAFAKTREQLMSLTQFDGRFTEKRYKSVLDARRKQIELFNNRSEMHVENYNKRVRAIEEKYNKLIASDKFKKSAKIQQRLREGLRSELAELKAAFDFEKGLTDRAMASEKERFDKSIERARELKKTSEEFAAAMARVNAAAFQSFSDASGFASQSAGQFAQGLANAVPIISAQVESFTAEIAKMGDANDAMSKAFAKGGPSMLSASGKVVAGFVEDQQTQAAIMGAMEAAASIAAFALMGGAGVRSGIMHGLASAMYFSIAGKGKKGSGGRGSKGKQPQQITRPPTGQQAQAANQITLNVSGTIVGNDQQAARHLADMLKKEMRWGAQVN